MTTSFLPPIHAPEDLIASIPHVLGFHPDNSLVVMAIHDNSLTFTIRVDLPQPQHHRQLAEHLLVSMREHKPSSCIFVVFGGGRADPPEALPHTPLIDVMTEAMASIGVAVPCATWVRACRQGEPWHCYDDPKRCGTVPDPKSSPLAAASVAAGLVTFADRAEMAGLVTPVADEVLARRSAMLDRAVEDHRIPASARLRLVRDTIAALPERIAPLTDDDIVGLTRALSDRAVRDASLAFAIGPNPVAAEQLWLELTRGCPAPERAEPATLLAFTAYLRGDGGLASVALQAAQQACPGHRLAGLLRHAIDCGLAPSRIRDLTKGAADEATWRLEPTES